MSQSLIILRTWILSSGHYSMLLLMTPPQYLFCDPLQPQTLFQTTAAQTVSGRFLLLQYSYLFALSEFAPLLGNFSNSYFKF